MLDFHENSLQRLEAEQAKEDRENYLWKVRVADIAERAMDAIDDQLYQTQHRLQPKDWERIHSLITDHIFDSTISLT